MKRPLPSPPGWTNRILKKRLTEEAYEEVTGDLHELFTVWVCRFGPAKAKALYVVHALGFLRPLPSKLSKTNKKTKHSYNRNIGSPI
ncbi:MAG: hypothetical protein EOO04_24770 [Chitinophagaceae bacterium]|nr:MAG: hypothetical protein EOO04_24770 [Chitinophagaceae bacterium]